jgi:hypothetical protein
MKLFTILVLSLISTAAFAGYDFVITEGDFVGLTLDNHQSLLMTGGGGIFLICRGGVMEK